ncbi:MAG: response regulator [Bryobacteraceae bacterium]|jgi:CheY-like chemotaxis protein
MRARERLCLIVDNEPIIRTYYAAILKHEGIRSVEAKDGVEALRMLQKLGAEIDLLITSAHDYQRPDARGPGWRGPGMLGRTVVSRSSSHNRFRQRSYSPGRLYRSRQAMYARCNPAGRRDSDAPSSGAGRGYRFE